MLVAVAAAAVTAAALLEPRFEVRERIVRFRAQIAIEQLVESVAAERLPAARFSALPATGVRAVARGSSAANVGLEASAGHIFALANGSSSPDVIAAAAAAHAVNRDFAQAVQLLEGAVARMPNEALLWSDLAAARLETHALLPALVAADEALRIDGAYANALYNRALVLDGLGLPPLAAETWRKCLDATSDAVVAMRIREKLKTAEITPERERFKTAQQELLAAAAAGDDAVVDRITAEFPTLVRRYAEATYWEPWLAGDANALRVLRNVGAALRRRGEAMTADAVTAIDAAITQRDEERLQTLAAATHSYIRGRHAYRDRDYAKAERELREAIPSFQKGGSPMANLAQYYLASVLINVARLDETGALLEEVLAAERPANTHRALIAISDNSLAITNMFHGRWNAAADAARRAAATFRDLGENAEAAESETVLAAIHHMVGQPDTGWRYRSRALKDIAAGGASQRLLAVLASATRAAIGAGEHDLALSLLSLEASLGAQIKDALMTADMLARRVVVQHARGAQQDRDTSLTHARAAIAALADEAERAKRTIELDTTEAIVTLDRNPARAKEILDKAVAFCRSTNQRAYLPGLLLQRGRAGLAMNADDAAWNDFATAIDELEAQRDAIADIALRARLFDTGEQLFDEAIAFQVRRGDAEAAFRVAERARARSLLDAIGGAAAPVVSSASVAAKLPVDTLLVEYAVLPEQLVIFTLTRNGPLRMHTVKVKGDQLASEAALLAPIQQELAAAKSVTFVPDKALQRTAFAALRFNGEYLVKSHIIAVAPSASRLVATEPAKRPQQPSLLVVGNPAADPQRNLEPLPSVGPEIATTRSYYGRARVLLDREATKAKFIAEAAAYDVIHFGGHGLSDDDSVTASLLFAGSDGRLDTNDIARMRLPRGPLVVLAACGTLRGRVEGVEGMPSLARSFLTAGASQVVGTLTDIDDTRAAVLLTEFHGKFARGESAAEALRQAQLAAIRRGDADADPKNWAQFVVYTATP